MKIQNEEKILERYRECVTKDLDNPLAKELFYKKGAYITELKKKYQAIEQECYLINARVTNAKKERNILMVLRILDEKCNILFAAYNLPIQGLGCELMAVALAKVHQGLMVTTANIINCVHDEIVIECNTERVNHVSVVLTKAMEEAFSEMFPNHVDTIYGLVETKIAKNWGEAK